MGRAVVAKRVKLAALDGTGFETRHISAYFVKRREKGQKNQFQTTKYTRYPYAGIVCDCASHFILAVVTGRGPGSDMKYFPSAVLQTTGRMSVGMLLADAGFDSERAHCLARRVPLLACPAVCLLPSPCCLNQKLGRPLFEFRRWEVCIAVRSQISTPRGSRGTLIRGSEPDRDCVGLAYDGGRSAREMPHALLNRTLLTS